MNGFPVCPDHGSAMKASTRGGGYFCTKKVGDGYCKRRADEFGQIIGQPVPAPVPAPAPTPGAPFAPSSVSDRVALAVAALRFAGELWGQVDVTMHPAAMETAGRAYDFMKARTGL